MWGAENFIGLMELTENLGRDDWIEEPYCVPSSLLYVTLQLGGKQRAKKVVTDSLGLVDFAIGLVNSVLNLPDGQVK